MALFFVDAMTLPLHGLRVVTLEQAVAAPLASRRLAAAGAEVFKIERPEGDFARYYDTTVAGQSAYFVWLNAGKKSVVLDLTKAQNVELLLKLMANSDVVVANLKPGALMSLGVDLAQMRQRHPRLITVSIAGFHPSGPGAHRKAYDLLMQAESGLASITGSPDSPGRVGVSLVDLATGNFAYQAILEALVTRGTSGEGQHIDIALFDAVAEWMSVPLLLQQHTKRAPERVGLAHPGICPYGVFYAQDDTAFVLSVQNEREWQRLCATIRPQLATDARCINNETRVTHRSFVDGTLQSTFGDLLYAEIDERLNSADLAYAPVNEVAGLAAHPDLRTYTIEVNGQAIRLPAIPGRSVEDVAVVPDLGQHTAQVLAWLETVSE